MPVTQFKRVIFGAKKDITIASFNIGSFTKAVAFDLKEFGQKGIQGMLIEGKNVEALVSYWKKAAKKNSSYYLMAGTASNGHLYFAVRDNNDAGFEQTSIAVKDYVSKRDELAKNNAEVVNLNPGNATIDGAADALKDKYKTTVKTEGTAELSKITGNIVLSAHGTPDTLKSGRIIGSKLAGKTPDQLVDMLVKQGLDKDFSGRLDLSGCFTASGGPAAAEKDKTYAEKVLSVLRKKGYSKVSVEAWPGPMGTALGPEVDPQGVKQKRGDEGVWANQQDKTGRDVQEEINALDANIEKISEAYQKLESSFPKDRPDDAGPDQDDWDEKHGKLSKLNDKWKEYFQKLEKLDRSEAAKVFANYKGVFGLRKI